MGLRSSIPHICTYVRPLEEDHFLIEDSCAQIKCILLLTDHRFLCTKLYALWSWTVGTCWVRLSSNRDHHPPWTLRLVMLLVCCVYKHSVISFLLLKEEIQRNLWQRDWLISLILAFLSCDSPCIDESRPSNPNPISTSRVPLLMLSHSIH